MQLPIKFWVNVVDREKHFLHIICRRVFLIISYNTPPTPWNNQTYLRFDIKWAKWIIYIEELHLTKNYITFFGKNLILSKHFLRYISYLKCDIIKTKFECKYYKDAKLSYNLVCPQRSLNVTFMFRNQRFLVYLFA